ncbi:MAG TPA: hemolysin family protein [Opitutaceae bacterium]|nr:hemolysin family protein [Opitutaceae bacterium]
MRTFLGILLETLTVVALVAANGFFVAAEFALVKVRTSQLRPLEKKGGWRVRAAIKASEHLDAALSATQLGITLASLGLGWIGEPFLAHRLGPLLALAGITDPRAVASISFAVAFTVITFLHIIFGELAPKSMAIQRAKGVSLWVSGPLLVFYYGFFPVIWTLNSLANRIVRWAGLVPATEGEHSFSADELEYVFSHASHAHPADALVNKLMVQSLRVRSTTAHQIMIPKEEVVVLWLDRPLKDNLRVAQVSGLSRFPVCRGNKDTVEGMLLMREWLWQIAALGPDMPFEPLIRPLLTFDLKTTVPTMIERFRAERSHLAVVRNEAGGMAGIVTFEDVLEEIVGDIRDEFDIEHGPIFERTATAIVVSAGLTMRELQAETGWPLEWTMHQTVGQWFQQRLGVAARRGDVATIGEYRLTATEVNAERLRRVRVERVSADEAEAPSGE